MPVFSATGWLLKGKSRQSQVATTGLTEQDIKKNKSGIYAKIDGGFSKKKLNLAFLIVDLDGADSDDLKNFKLYFKVNVDEDPDDDNGGWTSYIDTGKTLNVSKSYYSFTFKKNQFTGLVYDYIQRCTKCYISLVSSSHYLCGRNDDPDFKIPIK